MTLGIGDAPCGNCGKHIYNIPIILETKESDGNGGFWWQVANGGKCLECNEPLNWLHKSAPIIVNLPVLEQRKTNDKQSRR